MTTTKNTGAAAIALPAIGLHEAAERIRLAAQANRASQAAGRGYESNLTLMLRSAPGVGKSAIVRDVAREMGWHFRDVMLPNFDPADLAGLPYREGAVMYRSRPFFLDVPKDGPGILFLDELSQCSESVQNVVAQICHEGRVGEHGLPPGWTVVLAGNRLQDKAGVRPIVRQLANRIGFLEVEARADDWLAWSAAEGLNAQVHAYISWRREAALSDFDPTREQNATPRSWAKVASVMDVDAPLGVRINTARAFIGPAPAAEFATFLKVYESLPTVADIVADPEGVTVDIEPQGLYALCTSLSAAANTKNVGAIIRYVSRIERAEFGVFAAHDLSKRHPHLLNDRSVSVFWAKHAAMLTALRK